MSTLDPPTHEIPSPNTVQFVDHLVSQLQDYTTTTTTTDPDGNDYSGSLRHPRLVQNASAFPRALASRMPQVKQLMLTLHCLFPNELLLALDILDRGLVRRYQIEPQHQQQDSHHQAVNETATDSESPDNALRSRQETQSPGNSPQSSDGVFFVISTSSSTSSGSSLQPDTRSRVPRTGQKGYEVRLHAWNCSCPTFALAAYRDPGPEDTPSHLPRSSSSPTTPTHQSNSSRPCSFGGALTHGATKQTPPVCKHLLACFLATRCPGVFDHGDSSGGVAVLTADELACWCAGWGE